MDRDELSKLHFGMVDIFNRMEQLVIKPDLVDEVGVNQHLRVLWGGRDQMNAEFNRLLDGPSPDVVAE